jgi:hypothetical protein
VERVGYKKIIMKSDNEPASLALKEAVRRESHVEIVMEESSVGDDQANALAENTVKNVQGQFRVIKDVLENRHGRQVDGEHPVVPWTVRHAASVVNRARKDDEGFSAYRRWKGREFRKPVTEFGESVLHARRCPQEKTSSMPDGRREFGWECAWRARSP